MAQLRYTKFVACGTVAAAAGLGLVGIYLYKRKSAARRADQKKAAAAKALASEDKQNRNKKSNKGGDACGDCKKDAKTSEAGVALEESSDSLSFDCQMESMDNVLVEETFLQQVSAATSEATPNIPVEVVEELCAMTRDISLTEIAPPPLLHGEGAVVEEQCIQAADVSSTQTMMVNGFGDASTDVNGDAIATNGVREKCDSPFTIDGQEPSNFDWASSIEAAEKSVESPTCSNGSVAESDLGSEGNSEGSSFDSGRGSTTSTKDTASTLPDLPIRYLLEFPSKWCGKLIGKQGRNIRQLKENSNSSVQLKEHPYLEETHLVVIEGLQSEIDAALKYIKDRFTKVDVTKQYTPPVLEPSPAPEMSQLPLHEDIINDVYLSSVVSGAHVFVQQPTHPTFMALQRLDACMGETYNQQPDAVPELPRPIEGGVICAAPMMQGWYRAQVVTVDAETDDCVIKFLDYGGYATIAASALKQIRSDFMSLPFQAIECYLINLLPLPGEAEYSETSRSFVEHIAQNFNMLHAKVKGYGQDGVPLVELYYTDSESKSHSLNKELVNQGLVSWYEGYSDPADPVEVPDILEPYPLQDEEITIPQEPTDGAQLQV